MSDSPQTVVVTRSRDNAVIEWLRFVVADVDTVDNGDGTFTHTIRVGTAVPAERHLYDPAAIDLERVQAAADAAEHLVRIPHAVGDVRRELPIIYGTPAFVLKGTSYYDVRDARAVYDPRQKGDVMTGDDKAIQNPCVKCGGSAPVDSVVCWQCMSSAKDRADRTMYGKSRAAAHQPAQVDARKKKRNAKADARRHRNRRR